MAWVRLHLKLNGNAVYVNTKNISSINNDCSNKDEDVTCISFIGGGDDFILIDESIDEVMSRIETNETISMALSKL